MQLVKGDFEETTWAAFVAVTLAEKSPKTVAAELKISLNAVNLARHRVLSRLRQEARELTD